MALNAEKADKDSDGNVFSSTYVKGPASATNGAIATYNGTGGKTIQNSAKTITTSAPTSSATDSTIPTSKAVWSAISSNDTKVTQTAITATTSADYRILLSGSTNDTTETKGANKNTNLRFNTGTKTLSVGGSIDATGNLSVTGNTTLSGATSATNLTAGSLVVTGPASFAQSPTVPTPASTSNDTTVATTAFVMNAFTANDAMVFKGVVNANGNLPATHKQGWTYRVATAGTYAGKVCEVGDIIICVTDGTAANNDHWAVIQNNIDGAVTGPASATTNAIARYNGTTGKIIKNSNVTIDDTGNITTPGNINLSTGGANIVWNSDTQQQRIKTTDDSTADTPVFTFQQSSNSGSAWTDLMTIKDNGKVVATTFVGALDGNASTATKATQDESGNNIKASYASSFSISGHTITLQNKNGTSLGTVTVPDNDTKNTAGSTDTSNKIYLIGATSQADNPQTYSDNEVYVQNGTLYAVKTADLSGTANNKPALIVGGADTSTHMEIDANEIQAKTNGTSVAQLYINNDGGLVTVGSGGLAITSLTASQAVSTDANKKLVSTNLTVSDPTASGTGITYIATISQNATGKITATKSTVRSASTSQTGVTQYTEANTNTQLSTLTTTWTSTPTDDTLFIRRDTGGGATFGQVKFSTLWNYIKGKITAGTYWANIKISDAAKYNAAPEMATLKLNGNTSATAASTSNVTLVYDTTSQALNFVFA